MRILKNKVLIIIIGIVLSLSLLIIIISNNKSTSNMDVIEREKLNNNEYTENNIILLELNNEIENSIEINIIQENVINTNTINENLISIDNNKNIIEEKKIENNNSQNSNNNEIKNTITNKVVENDQTKNSTTTQNKVIQNDQTKNSTTTQNKVIQNDQTKNSTTTQNKVVQNNQTKNNTTTQNKVIQNTQNNNSTLINKQQAPDFSYSLSNTNITNASIVLKITTDEKNLVAYNDNNFIQSKSKTITNNVNNYIIKVKNNEGLVTEKTISINNIDKTLPNVEIIKTPTTQTEGKVTIQVNASDNIGLANEPYCFNNGEWTNNNKKEFSENVLNYVIKVKDSAGNITTETIKIDNIFVEKTTEQKNKDIINNIYNKYGFRVAYGEGTHFWYAGQACPVLYDHEKANTVLVNLQKILKNFPTGFFRVFQGQNGYRVSIFEDIPGNVAGLASYEFGDDNQMILDANTSFPSRVFYHETWHIMESYIKQKTEFVGKANPLNNWNTLNFSGFSYGNQNNTYTIYDTSEEVKNDPSKLLFISGYAKSYAHEDRAELFADLMFRAYKREYMAAGTGINEKAKYLANVIRQFWSNSAGASWERFITW